MTTTVSATSLSFCRPSSAFRLLLLPSTLNGRVTTTTVSAPNLLATSATTGEAPVPVPPPSPQVMKTRSASWRCSLSSASFSRAASSPLEGSLPAPSPPVASRPINSFLSAVA